MSFRGIKHIGYHWRGSALLVAGTQPACYKIADGTGELGFEGRRGSNVAKQALTALDLFSGCGGLTLGLKMAGFRVVGAVDNDDLSVETYLVNHPNVKVWHADIRSVDPTEIAKAVGLRAGSLGLLSACPPCQGFSRLRTGNRSQHVADDRNDLVFELVRFARVMRPRAIMMENVPGIVRDERLAAVIEMLEGIGYRCTCGVFDAMDYGVPQRRQRMVMVGGLGHVIPLSNPSGERLSVRKAIGWLPRAGVSGDLLHDWPERRSARVKRLIERIPPDGGSRTDLGPEEQLPCHTRQYGHLDVYGRMKWDDVAPTITSGCTNPSKGRFLHPSEPRAITLREAALLQSFPQTYVFSTRRGKEGVARMIGNAFPPDFVRSHAFGVAHALGGRGTWVVT